MSTQKPLPPNPDLRMFRNRVQALVNDQESKDDGAALSVADARNLVAREYGFDDWDTLRTAVEPASTYVVRAEAHKAALPPDHEFFRAVGALDIDRVRELLDQDPSLVNADVRGSASSHGADINILTDDGKTALDIAIEQENDTVAARLRERGGLQAADLP